MFKKIGLGLIIFCLSSLSAFSQDGTTFQNRPIIGEFYGFPVVKSKITKEDCENYCRDENGESQSIFANPWDAAISYYYQNNRERILISTDAGWNRLVFTSETFPGIGLPTEFKIGSYGSKGTGVGNFSFPMGIDISIGPDGGMSNNTGVFGAPDENDLHIFVADHQNNRIMHLVYENGENGPQILPAENPVISPVAQAGDFFPEMTRPVDVTCDPFYWDTWGQIYVLTKDRYIRSINLNTREWGSSVTGGPGGHPQSYTQPVSICARQGYLVAVDNVQAKAVLYQCTQNSIDYRDVYYFGQDSRPKSVSIDQFKDVLVADEGQLCVHKLHINDVDGGSFEYLTSLENVQTGEPLSGIQCVATGTKEELWSRFSDMTVFEGWSSNKGAIAYYNAADVLDVSASETYIDPGDNSLTLTVSFTLTGPIHYDLLEIKNNQNQRIYPPAGEPLSGGFGDAGRHEISVQLDENADLRGNYTFNITFDSEATKFTDGQPVVEDEQRASQFVSGYFSTPPDAPVLSDRFAYWGSNLCISWPATENTDYYYLEYFKNEDDWSDPIKLDSTGFVIDAEVMDTYSFRVKSANNRGYSQYSNVQTIFVDYPYWQTIELNRGWNWVSSNAMPLYYITGSAKIPDCVKDIAIENLEMVKDGIGRFYIPDPYFNNIPRWEYAEGYLVKTTASGEHMTMFGRLIDPQTPIELDIGWSYIAYFPQNDVTPEIALTSLLEPDILFSLIKDETGNFYSPEFNFNNIGFLVPGEGYQINMISQGTLIYDEGAGGASISSQISKLSPTLANIQRNKTQQIASEVVFHEFTRTADFFPNIILNIEVNEYNLSNGDEIAAYINDSTCIGASVYEGEFPLGLALWQDDTTTIAVDGYTSLDSISFKLWSYRLDSEIILDEINNIQAVITGAEGEVVLAQKAFGGHGDDFIPDSYFLSPAFPNPFNSSTTIKFGLILQEKTQVVIYDVNGREVKRLIDGEQKAGFYTVVWNGQNNANIDVSSGVYFCRLMSSDYNKTIKMMLVR